MEQNEQLSEKARQLLAQGGHATLATISIKHEGFPFASVTPYALDEMGNPIFLMSSLATHTRNLKTDPRATLLVTNISNAGELGEARVSVMGKVSEVPEAHIADATARYLHKNPEAQQWVSFGDFRLYRLEIVDIYLIAGFGSMGWVSPDEYRQAEED